LMRRHRGSFARLVCPRAWGGALRMTSESGKAGRRKAKAGGHKYPPYRKLKDRTAGGCASGGGMGEGGAKEGARLIL
jgi:hypothetical protein